MIDKVEQHVRLSRRRCMARSVAHLTSRCSGAQRQVSRLAVDIMNR